MTRESKIGLLVGLGFIIVVGILLSEHVAERTDPPAAALAAAGPAVRLGSAVPAGFFTVAPAVREGPLKLEPAEVVPTQADLRATLRAEANRPAAPIVALAASSLPVPPVDSTLTDLPVIGPSTAGVGGAVSVRMDRRGAEAPSATPAAATLYTVQPGDSLWRIAKAQTGNASAVAAIKDLNRDVLRGSDIVRPGMTLRLP